MKYNYDDNNMHCFVVSYAAGKADPGGGGRRRHVPVGPRLSRPGSLRWG